MRAFFAIPCFLLALACAAQDVFEDLLATTTRRSSSTPPAEWSWSPSNNSDGLTLLAWYVAGDYYTNAGNAILPDRWTNGFHLTNTAGASSPRLQSNAKNGKSALYFDEGDYLRNMILTNLQPLEVVMVQSHTNGVNTLPVFMDGAWSSGRQVWYKDVNTNLRGELHDLWAGTSLEVMRTLTAAYVICDMIWRSTSSTGFTNNVQGITGNAGGNALHGLIVGGQTDLAAGGFSKMSMLELQIWGNKLGSGVIPGTNTVTRSNVWARLKYDYGFP